MKRNLFVTSLSLFLMFCFFAYTLYAALTPYTISEIVMSSISIGFLIVAVWVFYTSLQHLKRLQHTEKRLSTVKKNLIQYIHKSDNLFNYANVGILEIKLNGQIMHANDAFCDLLNFDHASLATLNYFKIIDENDLCNLQNQLQELISGKLSHFRAEILTYNKNKESLWLISSFSVVRDIDDIPQSLVCQLQNITDQKKAESSLKHMAYHDSLTGLPNRHKLEQFLDQVQSSAKRYHRQFAILFLDLDRFKQINDTIGHDAGDTLLRMVSDRLLRIIRKTDMVSRLGGDEFVLVITDIDNETVISSICEKLLDTIRQPLTIQGQVIYITASIGISLFPNDGTQIQQLMQHADLALYRAKDRGRNNYQFYTNDMTTQAQHRMYLQNALAQALEKNEFCLHYQPVMDIKNRKIVSVEALLRWQNEAYKTVSPQDIIKLAEDTGLIMELSRWVLKEACHQLKQWHLAGYDSLIVSINCSECQFKQGHLIDDLIYESELAKIKPHSLCIEVTEEIIMNDSDKILRALSWIKEKGFKVSIDNFGTGYWSLKNMQALQISQIKIDKSFVHKMASDEVSRTMISSIISMYNRLNIDTVAEGVENKEQYEFLAKESCINIQGYYLTRPLAAIELLEFLKHPIPDAERIVPEEHSIIA